jgi:hypothetical protein
MSVRMTPISSFPKRLRDHALAFAFFVSYFRGEGTAAQAWADEMLMLATEQGFAHWQAQGMILRGWAVARQGHLQEGIEQLRQGLATWQAIGAGLLQPYWLGLLAETFWWVGQYDEGSTRSLRLSRRVRTIRNPGGRRSCAYSKANYSWLIMVLHLRQTRSKPVSATHWPVPSASRPSRWNCALR